jgi:plasmid replication initiation protein
LKISPWLRAVPYQMLKFMGRGTRPDDYDRLFAALGRPQGTNVTTNIRQGDRQRAHENHPLPFVCTTNLMERLDPACLQPQRRLPVRSSQWLRDRQSRATACGDGRARRPTSPDLDPSDQGGR